MRQSNLFLTAAILGIAPGLMLAQSSFPGFVPGNLVVTTSPIFIDQITPAGAVLNTLAIPQGCW